MVKSVIIPIGYSTLADCLANNLVDGGRLSVSCSACKDWRDLTNVQIAAMIVKFNPLYSPWDRRPPCPTCGRPRTFQVGGSPMRPCLSPAPQHTRDLHFAWWRERQRRLGNSEPER
jgi:hypothetical protein